MAREIRPGGSAVEPFPKKGMPFEGETGMVTGGSDGSLPRTGEAGKISFQFDGVPFGVRTERFGVVGTRSTRMGGGSGSASMASSPNGYNQSAFTASDPNCTVRACDDGRVEACDVDG